MSEVKNVKGEVRNMTSGNILKHILVFAFPMIISNACQQLYALVDTMVAGQNLGDTAIAAIGATASLYGFITNFSFGINSGCSIIVTQQFGAGDSKSIKRSIMGTIELNAIFAFILTVLSLLSMKHLLGFLNVPDDVYGQAYTYIMTICAGLVTTIAYNMCSSILIAFGNSKVPLVFVIIASIIHVILDYVFLAWLKMGVVGTAIATVGSQAFAAIVCGIYIIRNYKGYLPELSEFRIPKELLFKLLKIGIAMALTYNVIDVGTMLFERANNGLGGEFITAYSAARRYINVFMIPLFTIPTACATFIGQNYGARKLGRCRDGVRIVAVIDAVWGVLACIIVYIFARPMIVGLTSSTDPVVIENAILSLHIHLPLYAPLGLLFAFRFSLQAMGRTTVPIVSSAIEMSVKIISALFLIPKIGFVMTCMTEPITWVLCAVYLTIQYFWLVKKGLYNEPEVN